MSHALSTTDLLAALELEPVAGDRFRASNLAIGGAVVFGGQLLAQTVLAAHQAVEGLEVKTVHTTFLRGAAREQETVLEVERVHAGRSFATVAVTVVQGDRPCARSQVLLSSDEPDLIRHARPAPEVGTPEAAVVTSAPGSDWEIRVVGGVDVDDPEAEGPPELAVWTRFAGAPEDPAIGCALLAFATDGFLIGTAMRPHPGVGQALAHRTIATTVVSHTLTFHEDVRAGEWLLLDQASPYAGRGRAHGRGDAFDERGALVASFVQDSMIRAMA